MAKKKKEEIQIEPLNIKELPEYPEEENGCQNCTCEKIKFCYFV